MHKWKLYTNTNGIYMSNRDGSKETTQINCSAWQVSAVTAALRGGLRPPPLSQPAWMPKEPTRAQPLLMLLDTRSNCSHPTMPLLDSNKRKPFWEFHYSCMQSRNFVRILSESYNLILPCWGKETFPLLSHLRGHVSTESMYIAFIMEDKTDQHDVYSQNKFNSKQTPQNH